jgi:hypothetical protein
LQPLGLASALVLTFLVAGNVSASNKVTTVAVPNGGQPVAAKTDAQGTIHLLFDSADGPQYVKSTDHGKTFSKPIAVVDRQSRQPKLKFSVSDLAVSPQGHVHVAMGSNAWELKRPQTEWGFFYARLDPDAPDFTPTRNINRKPSEGFSLAADDQGRVTACWLSGKLYANVSRDNGKTFSPNAEIDRAWNPCDCCTTSADYGADGKLAVLYREETNNERDMFLVLWDQERNQTSRTRISSTLWKIDGCPMTYYSVARRQDGFVAIWPTKGQVYFTRLDGTGTPQSPAEIKTPGTTGMRTGMVALSSTDGSTLVAWKKDNQLGWQLYDQRGRPSGTPDSTKSAGNGVAGVRAKSGDLVLFR